VEVPGNNIKETNEKKHVNAQKLLKNVRKSEGNE
jgi:hypothetical protein